MIVSVALTLFNGLKYIEEQLDSIRLQTRKPDEVIIVDDCSNDGQRLGERGKHDFNGVKLFLGYDHSLKDFRHTKTPAFYAGENFLASCYFLI